MQLSPLTAISPIDGRYADHTTELRPIFSEYGLMHFRLRLEILWLQTLSEHPELKEMPRFTAADTAILNKIVTDFSESDALRIKQIEDITNHDVKAVEYFIKEKMSSSDALRDISEFVHFACTSEDINNLSHALMLQQSYIDIIRPTMSDTIQAIKTLVARYADQAMLARTHGQVASPTTMGKEMGVFVYRLQRQLGKMDEIDFMGKMNGAVGNFNAHYATYPDIDWPKLTENFVTSLGLKWNPYTTQIESHDYMAEYFQAISRFNTILIDFCRDIWGYISLGYFKQNSPAGETGSSTMPHKINPIDFENAEGNLELANCILIKLATKLPISRWQRDLTDSTIIRNNGTGMAYALLAYKSCMRGIKKLEINSDMIAHDLDHAWATLAEPIQMMMRRYSVKEPYEKLKTLVRGQAVNAEILHDFIRTLEIPETAKEQLLALTPASYTGNAAQQARSLHENDC